MTSWKQSFITHDFKIPVNQFRSLLTILNSTRLDELSKERYSREISESVENADLLLENLFALDKNYTDSSESQKSPVSMEEMLKTLLEYDKQLIKQKNLEILLEYDEDIIVFIDYQFILTVLRNLFSNSVNFSPDGGEIIISYKIHSTKVTISLENNSPGIPEEIIAPANKNEFIYSPTADSFGKTSTGHGLFICNYFLKSHKSKLVFARNKDVTKVSFSLDRYLV